MKNRLSGSRLVLTLAALVTLACSSSTTANVNIDGQLAVGTWGGDTGGFIVGDTAAHLHIGCTYGDIRGRIPLDGNGRFHVAGSYMLRAYPVAFGPTVPAVFDGQAIGNTVTITATVNDTVQHATVIRGPVALTFGATPQMANCPICRRPDLSPGLVERVKHIAGIR